MCDYRKLILKPSTKVHARHDLLLSSLRKKIRFRPPFGGRLSHNGMSFFNGRQNNGQTAFNELLRERYRQIELDQRNAAEKTRTVEEKLEGDVSAHRNKVGVSPVAHKNVFDYATLRKPRTQASPKRSSPAKASPVKGSSLPVVEGGRGPTVKAPQSPGAKSVVASTTQGKTTARGPAASGKPKVSPGAKSAKAQAAATTRKMAAEGSPVTGVKGAKAISEKSTAGDTKAPSPGAKSPPALTTQGKGAVGTKMAPPSGVKGAKAPAAEGAIKATSPPGVKGAKGPATLTSPGKGTNAGTKAALPSGVKGAKAPAAGGAIKATPPPGVKGAKGPATLTTQGKGTDAGTKAASPSGVKGVKGPAALTTQAKGTDAGTKVAPPSGVKGAKAPAAEGATKAAPSSGVKGAKAPPKKSPSPGSAASGAPSGVKATKPGDIIPGSVTAKSPAATGTPIQGVKGAAVKTVAPSTPAGGSTTTRKSSVTGRQYGCTAATSRTKLNKLPESAATGDTRVPSLRGSPGAGSKSPASLRTQPPSPQIAAGESTEFPVSPIAKLDSPTETMMSPDLSAAPGGDMKSGYTTPFSVKGGKYRKYSTVPSASDADGLTTKVPSSTPCFSWMTATKQTRGPFSRPLTFGTPVPAHIMSQEEQIDYEKREQEVQRAWRLSEHRISKTLPYPMRKPTYIRRPPALAYEQTRTFELRRDLTSKSKKSDDKPTKDEKPTLTLSRKAQKYIEPKRNLTQNLRYRQFKKQPIITEFFDKYYNKYKKPPFRIDASLNVKIADNALSRDLFPNDYHCLGDNENRPVKWLAIESLVHRTFSTASDVWSFGVTLWELTTLGQQPYVEVDPFEIEHYLNDGYRLSQPVNCPDELFAVMAYCWAMSADERPTFSQLLTCLQDFHNQLNKYV